MVKTFFSQSDENPLNDALEESESKCNQLRKSKENLEKEIHKLKIDNAKIVKNEEKMKIEVENHLLIIENEMYEASIKKHQLSQKFENLEKDRNELKAAKEHNERIHNNVTTKLRNTIEKLEKQVGEMKNSKDKMAENRKLDKQTRQKLEEKLTKLGRDCTDLRWAKNEMAKKALEFARQSEIQTNAFRSQNDKIKTAFLEIQGTMAEKIKQLEKQLKQSEIQINELSSIKDKAKMHHEMAEKIEQLEKQVKGLNAEKEETAKNSEKVVGELKIQIKFLRSQNDMISKTALKIHDEMAEKLEKLERQVNESDEIEKNYSMKVISELKREEQTKKFRYLPGHSYFPGKSEKEIKVLKDFISKRSQKEDIEKTVTHWILENNPILDLNHSSL